MKSMQKGFTLIELMIVVAIIAILAAIAIPQYQAYVIRSQVTRVMGEAGDQKVVVEDCLNNGTTGTITPAGGGAGGNTSACVETATSSALMTGTEVPAIVINTSGTASITSTFGGSANTVISGNNLIWTRSASGGWTCSTTVSAKYAPTSCPNG
ncbi:pilin [Dyella dinghuensis]|uniref:Pilin n=1 Tax=Dyella dinghuensis TaxID=1920169 RepID=A0A432LQI6_9GAMM|nr:pilin [Dyella dinghuensis]RUL62285.1 pilin [Dyella dinghuensis]